MALRISVCVALVSVLAVPPVLAQAAGWSTLSNPIDPAQLTKVPWGSRSHWLQPWRAYFETPPATRLRDGIGIMFNVSAREAAPVARLLRVSGFKRARIELSWNHMSYLAPTKPANPADVRARLGALKANLIRPLILLNSNSLEPTPVRRFKVTLAAAAGRGARSIRLTPASAAQVIPRRTGLDIPDLAAGVLFTSVNKLTGTVTLSKPLPTALPAGARNATTLRFEPFAPPQLADGRPNPRFEATLQGWLSYVKGIAQFARATLGSTSFDVEIWNELGFGSAFLSSNNYYSPPQPGKGDPVPVILQRTIAMLRSPANGLAGVGIASGFASQTPWVSGATVPAGLTALSKHPYNSPVEYPAGLGSNGTNWGTRPVNALGAPDYTETRLPDGSVKYVDRFIPTYRQFMPEYFLTAIQTESLVRDLAPWNETFGGVIHGRSTAPPGGAPPQMWLTEYSLNMGFAPQATLARERARAKAAMRTLVAYLNKGATMVDLFSAKSSIQWQMVSPAFLHAAASGAYPSADPGPTMRAVGRLAASVRTAQPIAVPRQLGLAAIADNHNHRQFEGDGTPGHPPLYNRNVLAVLPFQLDAHRFAVPVYVMTRDLGRVWQPALGTFDPRRYDLPEETYRLTLRGLDAANVKVAYTDPLFGLPRLASVVSRSGDQVVVQLRATDSPRVLLIDDTPAAAPPPPPGCTSNRRFRLELDKELRRAKVWVDGKRAKVKRRKGRLTAVIDLRGKPQGFAKVKIRGKTISGRTRTKVKRVRTCGKPKPPPPPCSYKRKFALPLYSHLADAKVRVGGRRAKVVRRKGRLTARVHLRGAPDKVVKVKIRGRTRNGARYKQVRRLRFCATP